MQDLNALVTAPISYIQLFTQTQENRKKTNLLSRLISKAPEPVKVQYVMTNQIHHKYIIICSERIVALYHYEIDEVHKVTLKLCWQTEYSSKIKYLCSNRSQSGFGNLKTFVAIVFDTHLELYLLDERLKKIQKKSDFSITGIRTINFLNQNSLFVVTQSNQLIRFDCGKYKIKQRTKLNLKLNNPNSGKIAKSFILGEITEQIQDRFYYVFVTEIQANQKWEEYVFIKELWKKNQNIEEGTLFLVKEVLNDKKIFQKIQIIKYKQAFCLQLEDQIEIVKKRHSSYYIYDNIMKRDFTHKLALIEDGTLCSVSDTCIELSKIILGQPKCTVKVVDVVYFNSQQNTSLKAFLGVQMYKHLKQYNYALLFQEKNNPKQIAYTNLMKIKNETKLLDLIQNKKIEIAHVQELASNLNISKRQFYLRLWFLSDQQFKDVEDKLINCEDVSTIKKQFKHFLKRKKIQLYQIKKVYDRLYEIIKSQLKIRLTEKLIRQRLKCQFLIRKIKIQSDMTKLVDFQDFTVVRKKGIIDYIEDAITEELKNEAKKSQPNYKPDLKAQTRNLNLIRDVLSEFKIIILEDYQNCLQKIIMKFPQHLELIFSKFFFLVPQHPYNFEFKQPIGGVSDLSSPSIPKQKQKEKQKQTVAGGASRITISGSKKQISVSEEQETNLKKIKTFSPIQENQWYLQLSVESLIKELSQYHLTSAVQGQLSNIAKSTWTINTKLVKHGFITSPRGQYIKKCSKNSGNKLFLKVCQLANIYNYQKLEGGKMSQVLPICFGKSNGLKNNENDYSIVSFYSKLHYFMLNQNLGSKLSIDKLIRIPDDELISLFFLGKRQKSELIFTKLKDLYDSQKKTQAFVVLMQRFVNSQNCSPVEINLLTQKINNLGKKFQQSNQALIEIVIDGFCSKLQVREQDRIDELIGFFKPIQLCQSLNEKIIMIMKISELRDLFQQFQLERQTIQVIQKEGTRILIRILENYFQGKFKDKEIFIDKIPVSLETPRNMLNILIYLEEKLYPDIEVALVVELYGKTLIDYQLFDVLLEVIYEEQILEQLNIDTVEFAQSLVRQSLKSIYNDKQGKSFYAMKQHMQHILNLQRDTTLAEFIIERARFQFCDFVSQYHQSITPFQIKYMHNGFEFLHQFIKQAYSVLTIDKIVRMYECLVEMEEIREDNQPDNQLPYIELFAQVLLKNNKIQQSVEVILYLIENIDLESIYNLVTNVFLRSLMLKYNTAEQFQVARKFIQIYIQVIEHKDIIYKIIKDNYDESTIESYEQNHQQFNIGKDLLFFEWKPITLMYEEVIKSLERIHSSSEFCKYYYFALVVLIKPEQGFKILQILDNYDDLSQIINLVSDCVTKNEENKSNFKKYQFKKFFFKGLWEVAVSRKKNILLQSQKIIDSRKSDKLDFDCESFETQIQYINLINLLKSKPNESSLVKSLIKLQRYLRQNKLSLNKQVQDIENYRKELQNYQAKTNNLTERKVEEKDQSLASIPKAMNRTMTLNDYLIVYHDTVNNMTAHNPNVNEREVMSMIWQPYESTKALKSKGQSKSNNEIIGNKDTKRILDNQHILEQHEKQEQYLRNRYFEMFDNYSSEIETMDREELLIYLRQYYYSEKSIRDIIALMQYYKIGEEINLKIANTASRILTTNLDFKQIFSFDFYFYIPEIHLNLNERVVTEEQEYKSEEAEYYRIMFEYLTPAIKANVNQETVMYLGKIMKMSLKYDQIYQQKVYMLALEKLLEKSYDQYQIKNVEKIADQYLSRLCFSIKFVYDNFNNIYEKAYNNKMKKLFVQRLKEALEINDKKPSDNAEIEMLQIMERNIIEKIKILEA